jgi:23S rRNA pseudouridine1911/1915/1917 synthase
MVSKKASFSNSFSSSTIVIMALEVLYEDNHIIAVYKPAGLLVQGDKTGDESLMDRVAEYLKDKYKKQGNVFLGLVHRLDRNVSGIVLFAKTSKGAARLSEQFRNNEIKKIYFAVVEGKISPASGDLVHYLKKDEERRIALVSNSPKTGYDRSELEYKTIKSNGKYVLVKINLKTGRFHQIRAQLSAVGHPVVGDKKYLPAGRQAEHLKDNSIALCATEIEFKTATTDAIKTIKVDYPKEWNKFVE